MKTMKVQYQWAEAVELYEWLLAEARWHAEWSRDAWAEFANILDTDSGTRAKLAKPLPWEPHPVDGAP